MCSPLKIISRTALVVLTLTSPLCAEETPLPFASQMKLARPTFAKGQRELAVNASAMFSPCIVSDDRPTVNYSAAAIQYGRMLTDVRGDGFWRGNTELLGEVFGGGIFTGGGTYLVGSTGWLRYNFVQEGWRVVPFAQMGAGLVITDVDRRLQGQDFNFNLEIGAGLRWFFRPDWSLDLEYRFQHISNAGMNHKNIGVNAEGFVAGVSWFF